ncbi:hypothetical protein SAMN05421690_10471 [Nitrosomonas sp. Nm51]|uniref:hypothetical protein n=1 Tax=Nitrosomonas sp. Nm51 TaxID=133720 RepID=UPI0008C99C55|nr:hypothetical protein [Nitrosomonas sp. Nm51]SER63772.1 hypothetical protein SAMN05421690_10471 [Nitrosomonas sp. Nm51]
MAVTQINQSFQNDGNFSQLDLRNVRGTGPVMRIETFRCSQPEGDFGKTASGTEVASLAGKDHLTQESNQIFRHIYSTGDVNAPLSTLEIREIFEEDGSFDIRVRDIDYESQSFGDVLVMTAKPLPNNTYQLTYDIRTPKSTEAAKFESPLTAPISETATGLADISSKPENLGEITDDRNTINAQIKWNAKKSEINQVFAEMQKSFKSDRLRNWAENIQNYERMGDFRDKCIHDGTNLSGPNPDLASEFHLIRAYRASLIGLGVVADPDMTKHNRVGMNPLLASTPVLTDPKPGVYSVFLSAYMNNIGIYQLGIDKVHSDYGGVPMKLAPGSRLEDASSPIVDSSRFNRTLAELAFAFYIGPTLPVLNAFKEMEA